MNIYIISPPSPGKFKMTREGRCMQRQGVWTTSWPPISLAMIAAILRQEGHHVKINDCSNEGLSLSDWEEKLQRFYPDVLIINSTTPTIAFDLSLSDRAKAIIPDIKTAAFGIHVSALPTESFELAKGLDVIVRGEPEYSIRALIKAWKNGNNLEVVEGISYRKNDKIIHNKQRPFINDLDELPFPAWDLIDLSKYLLPFTKKPFCLVASSRGCPFDCSFCVAPAFYGRKVRFRAPELVVKEMSWMKEKLNVENFFFWSESFTLNRKYILDICKEIEKQKLLIRWVCNSRVDNIDHQLLQRMKETGCWLVSFGAESAEQSILDRAGKGIKIAQVESAVKIARQTGLQISGHFVLGLPGETKETMKKTIRWARSLDLDYAQFYCAVPWPGSRLYEEAKGKGWLVTNDWSRYEQSFSVLNLDEVTATEIMQFRHRADRSFYLYPRTIWRTLCKLKSYREWKSFFTMVRDFLSARVQ